LRRDVERCEVEVMWKEEMCCRVEDEIQIAERLLYVERLREKLIYGILIQARRDHCIGVLRLMFGTPSMSKYCHSIISASVVRNYDRVARRDHCIGVLRFMFDIPSMSKYCHSIMSASVVRNDDQVAKLGLPWMLKTKPVSYHNSMLKDAIRANSTRCVRVMLQAGIQVNMNELLTIAVECGHVNTCRLLLVHGARITSSICKVDRRSECSMLRIYKSVRSVEKNKGPRPILSNEDRAFLREVLLSVGRRLQFIFTPSMQWLFLALLTYNMTFLWYPHCLYRICHI